MIPRLFHQHQGSLRSALRRKRTSIGSDSAFTGLYREINKLIRMLAMRVSELNGTLEA